ncbi:MAG: hypothetical protein RR394_09480 [Oscillospiraceae bacterium]
MPELEAAREKLEALKARRKALQSQLELARDDERSDLRLELAIVIEDILSATSAVAAIKGKPAPRGTTSANPDRYAFERWKEKDNEEGNAFREAQLSAIKNVEAGSRRQRQVLKLRRAGGKVSELGCALGVSASTVSRTCARAKTNEKKAVYPYVSLYAKCEHSNEKTEIDLDNDDILQILGKQLTPKQQVALYLHFGERLSYSLCGEMLGKSKTTVIRNAHRGIARLDACFPPGTLCFSNLDALPGKILDAYNYMQHDFCVNEQRETAKTCKAHQYRKSCTADAGPSREIEIAYSDGAGKIEKPRILRSRYKIIGPTEKPRGASRLINELRSLLGGVGHAFAAALEQIMSNFFSIRF